jgi:glutamate-1-semialdehyde 2,1-aminomutase
MISTATAAPTADPRRLAALHARERARYVGAHPRSAALAAASQPHYLWGLPLHWMRDWALPHPLFVEQASGNRLRCVDGIEHIDYCLGDSGAMFGHSPPPLARALAAQAARGLTAMLPGSALAEVGAALQRVFGLPRWQLALSASDANRFVLRWARALTGRRRIAVFDGCYHGSVDDTLVDRAPDGRTLARASLLGPAHDPAAVTVVLPFNDAAAVEAALAPGDIACVLTEPALTNCGLVPPQPGFLEAVQAACARHGTLWVLDETHTLSSGPGGWARLHGLQPDLLVVGKAVAGGVPCAVYGFGDALAQRMAAARAAAPAGHSGIGTTLAGSLLALAALRASLDDVMTDAAWAAMLGAAGALHGALEDLLRRHRLPWSVTRLGARLELQFCRTPPRDAQQARAAFDEPLERALHLYLLNRGLVVTPFHNMLLVPPMTGAGDIAALVDALDGFVGEALG